MLILGIGRRKSDAMNWASLFLDFALFAVGVGALVWLYLPFSPMTRDMVVFLSRDAQISLFRARYLYWTVGILCLAVLLARVIFGFSGSYGVLASGAAHLGQAHWAWLIPGIPAVGVISVLYWAMFVPIVMAPPKVHHLVSAGEADEFLADDQVVLGLEREGWSRAYPRDLIARPHWFNDEIDAKPVMISYCILCNSGQAFIPVLKDGRRLDLRNMTAFDNNTIYHCVKTGNFIQQLDGRVVRGPNKGEVLESFPVIMARWGEWKRLHPETTVYYAPPVNFRDRFTQKMLMKMVPLPKLAARDEPWHLLRKKIDDRLPAMAFVIGVEIGGDYCAFPIEALKDKAVVNDTVGGRPVAVFYDKTHDIGQAFMRRLGDKELTFENATPADDASMVARDKETGSTWNVSGQAIDGELKGSTLEPAPHWNQLFWFSWAAFKPQTRIAGMR